MDIFFEILKLGAVGLTAGLFSAWLGSFSHRNRKWWELKVEAYKNVIEALSDIVYYFDIHYSAEIEQREISNDRKVEVQKFWGNSYHKIRKYADSGTLFFSIEANQALVEFMKMKNKKYDSYFEHLDSYYVGAERCLASIVDSARKDLKLNASF
ncbi:hypothetical protein EBI01_05565 [Marinomonas rhizomae]|uniref:Uncharacterized protein n=1 Tax=Marinomonas rhizomae TaxID=491948 RepID=A0A366JD81_9GAMM|nr:hypothetical protein [Marinomonas rhizomae]RBP84245.1 hypothetical protein DFP80_104148 [Marinomonas rhizomae]RNF74567.1 hypothetical protein EBI01_05565 [Marinomonas rhizomae]